MFSLRQRANSLLTELRDVVSQNVNTAPSRLVDAGSQMNVMSPPLDPPT